MRPQSSSVLPSPIRNIWVLELILFTLSRLYHWQGMRSEILSLTWDWDLLPILLMRKKLVLGNTTINTIKLNRQLSDNVDIGMILLVGLAYKVSERIKFYSEYKHSTLSYDLFLLRGTNTNFTLAFDTADNNFMAGFKYIFKGWK
jgi:opacity protein-like surface antigen